MADQSSSDVTPKPDPQAEQTAADTPPKQNSVMDNFMNRVDAHLPSKKFRDKMRDGQDDLPSTQKVLNGLGLVAGAEISTVLARYANPLGLGPEDDPAEVNWAELDLLLVVAQILPHAEPWRGAFLNIRDHRDALARLTAAAQDAGVPVILWVAEEASAVEMCAHLFDLADHIILPPGARAYPTDASKPRFSLFQGAADVKTFNPVSVEWFKNNTHRPYVGFLLDGAHEIGMGMGPKAARDYFDPVFDYNWWLTDSSYEMRNGDRKIHAVMRRRFMGAMRGAELAHPLRLATAYYLPGLFQERRAGHMRQRALEAAASKTLVFTDAERTDLPHVTCVPTRDDLSGYLDWVLQDVIGREAAQHLAWRDCVTQFTYFEFLDAVFAAAGKKVRLQHPRDPLVNVVVPTVRPDLVPYILESVGRQVHPNLQLNIVVNSSSVDDETRRLVDATSFAKLHTMPSYKSIGYCINYGIDQADGDYWAKFDDDDVYGPHYLSDMLLQRKYLDFDITGKASIFTYMEEFDRINIRKLDDRDAFRNSIGGGTILARDGLNPFPEDLRGYADTMYLMEAAEKGYVIASADPFNFMQIRRADPSSHTWTAGAQQLNLRGPQRHGLNLTGIVL